MNITERLLNRKNVEEFYNLKKNQVAKLFHYLDKRKLLVKIGRQEYIHADNLNELFKNGITIV